MTEPQEDRDLMVLLATVQIELHHQAEKVAYLSRRVLEGNGHGSLIEDLVRMRTEFDDLKGRLGEWRKWFWTLAGSLLVTLAAAVAGWLKP